MRIHMHTATKASDACEALLQDEESQQKVLKIGHNRNGYSIPSIVAWMVTVVLALIIGTKLKCGVLSNDRSCTLHVTQGSPLLRDINISYETKTFNGTFLTENVFRQSAGPEVDAAWESLGANYRSVAIQEHLAAEAGLRHDQVKINSKYGGGFPANVEGLHHLHCLNLLRQALYYNFDYYHALKKGAFKNDDHILKLHVSHCLDILRQQLVCTVDIGVLGQVWYNPASPAAFVDFNTKHKCRNFDDVRKWAESRQLPEEVPMDFLQPPEKGDRIFEGIP